MCCSDGVGPDRPGLGIIARTRRRRLCQGLLDRLSYVLVPGDHPRERGGERGGCGRRGGNDALVLVADGRTDAVLVVAEGALGTGHGPRARERSTRERGPGVAGGGGLGLLGGQQSHQLADPCIVRRRSSRPRRLDRKSTRLNSSHMSISYAVFCLKKKKKTKSYPSL